MSLFNEGDFVTLSQFGKESIYPDLRSLFDGALQVTSEPMRGLRVWDKTHTYWIDCGPGGNGTQYLEIAEDLDFEDVDTKII